MTRNFNINKLSKKIRKRFKRKVSNDYKRFFDETKNFVIKIAFEIMSMKQYMQIIMTKKLINSMHLFANVKRFILNQTKHLKLKFQK